MTYQDTKLTTHLPVSSSLVIAAGQAVRKVLFDFKQLVAGWVLPDGRLVAFQIQVTVRNLHQVICAADADGVIDERPLVTQGTGALVAAYPAICLRAGSLTFGQLFGAAADEDGDDTGPSGYEVWLRDTPLQHDLCGFPRGTTVDVCLTYPTGGLLIIDRAGDRAVRGWMTIELYGGQTAVPPAQPTRQTPGRGKL